MITLVLGGARSGKSAVAEALAAEAGGPVTYVATTRVGDDPDLLARIAEHRRRRPREWTTIECGSLLVDALDQLEGTILIDSVGAWVAGSPNLVVDTGALLERLARHHGDVVVVSDEVGMGVHPSSEVGRSYRDALGVVNQALANDARRVLLVVAGQVLTIKPPGGS